MKRFPKPGLFLLLLLLGLGPGCSEPSATAEGRLYYTLQEENLYRIDWTDPEGSVAHPFLGEGEEARSPAVASDGLTLAYLKGSPPRVYLYSLATRRDEQVSTTTETPSRVAWGPVGRQLAYLRYLASGKVQLVLHPVGSEPRVLYEARNLGLPTWSRLGNRLYFTETDAAGVSRILTCKKDGSGLETVLEGASTPCVSPRGDAMIVLKDDKIQSYDLESKKLTLLLDAPGMSSPS